jgi:hypothetical protein
MDKNPSNQGQWPYLENQPRTPDFSSIFLDLISEAGNFLHRSRLHHRSQLNPFGVKGTGEVGIVLGAGLMANTMPNALSRKDIQVTELTLSPQAVWDLMNMHKK